MSLRGPVPTLTPEAEGRVYGWDGMGWDGVSKVSFNFLYTLCVCRSCLCPHIYVLKTCHQHPYGFQNLVSSWGWGNTIFEITLCTWVLNIWFQTCHFGFWFSHGFLKNYPFFRKSQKPFLLFKIENSRYRTWHRYMVLFTVDGKFT